MGHEPAASFTRSARDRPRPGSPSGRGTVSTRPARPGSPRRTSSTSAPTSPVGSPRTGAQSGAVKAHDLSEPLLSSWLDPLAPAASSQGNTDKELVQRHSETCKQLRAAHSARNELELQIAQLHALGPQAVWRKRILVAEAAGGAAEAEAARLRGERQKWSQRWQGLRTLLQAGQLEALHRALDAPPFNGSAADSPQSALGSAATLPTDPTTVDALESRVRPDAPQPRAPPASRASHARAHIRMPHAACANMSACPPYQHGAPPSRAQVVMQGGCNPNYPGGNPVSLQVAIGVEAEMAPVRVQPVIASWCGKVSSVEGKERTEEGGRPRAGGLGCPRPLELRRSVDEAGGGEVAAGEAEPTAAPTASDPIERSSAHAAPVAPAESTMVRSAATTAAGVVVPALNIGKDFLSRLAAAESGERGSSSW